MAVPLFNAVCEMFVAGRTMCRVCLSRSTSSQQILHRHMSHLLLLFFRGGQFGSLVFLVRPSSCIVTTTSVSPSRQRLDLKLTFPFLWASAYLFAALSALCSHVVGVLTLPHMQVASSGLL